MKQLAPVIGEAGGGRAEGRAELVGAQHQVRWHAGGEQGGGGEQAAASGNGIDEAGNESDGGKNREGGEVYAEFERHGLGLIDWAQKGCAEGSIW
ncbi:hypothetical protein D9M71_579780 [compost metagenome]